MKIIYILIYVASFQLMAEEYCGSEYSYPYFYSSNKLEGNMVLLNYSGQFYLYESQDYKKNHPYRFSFRHGFVRDSENNLILDNKIHEWENNNKAPQKELYYPLSVDPELPVQLGPVYGYKKCQYPYLRFEELTSTGFKFKFKNKIYYSPMESVSGVPVLPLYYLDEAQEKKWIEKLNIDKKFIETFEKIKTALIKHDSATIQSLMLPGAEDKIKEVYKKWKKKEHYWDFFWTFACNPYNLRVDHLAGDTHEDCSYLRPEFPLVTYRPWWWSYGYNKNEVVFIRFTSTIEVRMEDNQKYNVALLNQFGDQGFALVRQGEEWKIKEVFLDNNFAAEQEKSMALPTYWGRVPQFDYASNEEQDGENLYGKLWSKSWETDAFNKFIYPKGSIGPSRKVLDEAEKKGFVNYLGVQHKEKLPQLRYDLTDETTSEENPAPPPNSLHLPEGK